MLRGRDIVDLSIDGDTVWAYGSTEVNGCGGYYDAEVDMQLYEGEQARPVTSGGVAGGPSAEGFLSAAASAALFELDSDHSLNTAFDAYNLGNAVAAPGDPQPQAPSHYGGGWWSEVAGDTQYAGALMYPELQVGSVYAGSASWQEYGESPVINGISSPNGVTLNSTGTLTIAGLFLTATETTPPLP